MNRKTLAITLLAAASACHKLWYLHHCADHGITVLAYRDDAEAEMNEAAGRMTAIRLKPRVTISAASDPALALALHHDAHRDCYIANTLNCPVTSDAHIEHA